MKYLKTIFCIGLFALIGLLAMPPGAMASDGFFIDNQTLTADQSTQGAALAAILADSYVGDIIAMAPASIANGLRSGWTALEIENGETRKHLIAWNGEDGDATAYSKALHQS